MQYDYIIQVTEILLLLLILRTIHWFVYWIYNIIREIIDGIEKS